jgi:uncharacterized protein (TIGR01244 family)
MADIRFVTDTFAVAPQIAVADLPEITQKGFTLIICNRPDGEAPDQPAAAAVKAATEAAGLGFVHIPVVGAPNAAQAEALHAAIAEAPGPVLAYCRSGTRSILAWTLSEAASGARGRDELIALGRAAGYDVSAFAG